ncbi:hypothetical protein MMC20_001611 [Loxospora ochrophaea]|nr:hypothetical protein [Loxospora ochrophaea]
MSAAPSEPTPSPIPVRHSSSSSSLAKEAADRPHPKPSYPNPKLRLKVGDLSHKGALIFFSNANPAQNLLTAVETVLSSLYSPSRKNEHIPPTRSVTLILRSMPGVAYTTGTDLDSDHKEIHFSLDYIAGVPQSPPTRQAEEIAGVLVHEMVHCWQWNALGTAPSGLIEGIADFVRLKAGLSPPHWRKEAGGDWDAGYQHTGYFLDWVESICGEGSVRKVNLELKDKKYVEGRFWKGLFGKTVAQLWQEYSESLEKRKDDSESTNSNVESAEEEEGVLVEKYHC